MEFLSSKLPTSIILPQPDGPRPHPNGRAGREIRRQPDCPDFRREPWNRSLRPITIIAEARAFPPRRARSAWIEPIALVLLSLAINLAGNARTGLWDRDEPRYAVAVREMRTGATGSSPRSTASRAIISRS